jgi:hypothetical protein
MDREITDPFQTALSAAIERNLPNTPIKYANNPNLPIGGEFAHITYCDQSGGISKEVVTYVFPHKNSFYVLTVKDMQLCIGIPPQQTIDEVWLHKGSGTSSAAASPTRR